MSGKNFVKVHYTRAYLTCPHCEINLPEVWTQGQLVRNEGGDDERMVADPELGRYCPNCGRKYHFPERLYNG